MARSLPKSLRMALTPKATAGQNLDPAAELLSCVNRAITKEAHDNERPPSRAFHPSSMQCERNMFYQLKGVAQEGSVSVELVGICDSGTDRHLRLQKLIDGQTMRNLGWHYVDVAEYVERKGYPHLEIKGKGEMETKLYDRVRNVSFMTDGILHWDYTGKDYVLEIKTEASMKFYKRTGVDPKHHDQGVMYALEFGIEDVIFLYESRDNTAHKTYLFHVTPEMVAEKEAQIQRVTGYSRRNELPPLPSEETRKYACTYCPYANLCHMNHNGDGMVDKRYGGE